MESASAPAGGVGQEAHDGGRSDVADEEVTVNQPATTEQPMRFSAAGICLQAAAWAEQDVEHTHGPDDLCPCPHWGTVVRGSVQVRWGDGRTEIVAAGGTYYWEPGHTVRVAGDYEAIEFSTRGPMRVRVERIQAH